MVGECKRKKTRQRSELSWCADAALRRRRSVVCGGVQRGASGEGMQKQGATRLKVCPLDSLC